SEGRAWLCCTSANCTDAAWQGANIEAGLVRTVAPEVVTSYFRATGRENVKTRVLLNKARQLDYLVTATEKEALLLESSLIKKHRPRYNVSLRDDKSYPSLRIDPREEFPRLEVVRRFQRDGAVTFGPYTSAHAVRETLKLLRQVFPLRLCRGKKLIPRERPCLNYSLGQCLGACAGKVSREEYHRMVDEVILFLQGKTDMLQKRLKENMQQAADSLEFEKAAFYRDRLHSVLSVLEKQHMVSGRMEDQDVIGLYQGEEEAELVVLFVRQGAVIGQRSFDLREAQGDEEELITDFIQQYYEEGRYIPDEILVPQPLEDQEILEEWLSELKNRKVRVWAVKRGERKNLLEMARSNARERHGSRKKWQKRDTALLEGLQRALKLPAVPRRMACVDISNIQGLHAVGAVVVFADGQPDKGSYRHFRIKNTQEPDDPAMMAEVIERLFSEEPGLAQSLDLLVLDGGKGQLNRIHHLLRTMGVVELLPLISIAKEREEDIGEQGRGMYEKIYLPGRKNPLHLSRTPDVLHLLQRLRDEAHRFAISRYKSRHRRELLSSVLDGIPGVGPRRRQALLRHFG
ncbi:MAG: excinuclease ABC subunit UvrC, partial [Syntrophobacteraceae bacterium]|nr:excinuclease ABC subunit UvrC [Syntrophobacteraceae bacterium]